MSTTYQGNMLDISKSTLNIDNLNIHNNLSVLECTKNEKEQHLMLLNTNVVELLAKILKKKQGHSNNFNYYGKTFWWDFGYSTKESF